MELNGLTLPVVCSFCNTGFRLFGDGGVQPEIVVAVTDDEWDMWASLGVSSNTLEVVLFYCPNCGSTFCGQIDNHATKGQLREVTQLAVRLATRKRDGKEPSKQDQNRFNKCRKQLASQRERLKRLYNGKSATNIATGRTFRIECIS